MSPDAGWLPAEADWRLAADPLDLREYDAFGPWIAPVSSKEEMPRRFRPHYAEHAGAKFLLKIPRDEDRTDLRPGMDLFAAVLAIHNEGVCLLRLDGGEVSSRMAAWNTIVGSRYRTELLLACWSLLLEDGSAIDVNHNSAAGSGLSAAMALVDARISAATAPGWRVPLPAVGVGADFFGGRLNQLRRQLPPPVVPIHYERANRLCLDQLHRPRLGNGLLIVDSQTELVIISRGPALRSRFLPSQGTSLTRVPYERLRSFWVSPPPDKRGHSFHKLTLRAGDQRIVQWCLDRPDGVTAALTARGVPQVDPEGEPGLWLR